MPRWALMGFVLCLGFFLLNMLYLLPRISIFKHKLLINITFSQPPSILYSSSGGSLWLGMFVLWMHLGSFRSIYLNQLYISLLLELVLLFFLLLCVRQVPRDAVQEAVEVLEVFSETLRHTRTWFRNALNQTLLKEYLDLVMFSLYWELQVCNLLIM